MNITQAKALAGIQANLSGKAAYQGAMQATVKQIALARKAGDDTRAAELSQAKQVFKKRALRNTCEICGQVISNKATLCMICARKSSKALPGPLASVQAAIKAPRPNNNARVAVAPEGGPLARLGYYCKPVQAVLSKWRSSIKPEALDKYFFSVAMPVIFRETKSRLPGFIPPQHWPVVFELGNAICAVFNDTSKPEAWLLRQNDVATNGQFDSWQQIADDITRLGGPRFQPGNLRQAARRIKLITPPALAKDWKDSRPS